jgi:hypothetical protein
VVLDVLSVGEVGGVAAVLDRQVGDGAQLLEVQLTAVDAHAQHEELVVELLGLQRRGLATVDAGTTLRVQAPPAEASAHVAGIDRVEAAVRVDVLDAGAHVERVVVLLGLLVGVERLAVPERPLALAALLARTSGGGGLDGSHVIPSVSSTRRGAVGTSRRAQWTKRSGAREVQRQIMVRARPRSTWRRSTSQTVSADCMPEV